MNFYNQQKIIGVLAFSLCLSAQISGQVTGYNPNAPLKLIANVSLPGVSGRIDHLAYNSNKHLVYVAALGNNTIEVVDLKKKKVIHNITGLSEPQGIRYIPETNVIFVANGGNGECSVFDAKSYQKIGSVKLNGDADNVRYNPAAKKIYVGYGNGGIAVIDAITYKILADIKLEGHPESFQLARNTKIFVNVPDAHLIEVIDLEKNIITDKWEIKEATSNFPMALDDANHRLFIGCRQPAKLLVINTENAKAVASFATDGDADDIFYDDASNQIFMTCGGGFIDIFRQVNPDKYDFISRIETRNGARTSIYVPERKQLIIALPARPGKIAQLMICEKNEPK